MRTTTMQERVFRKRRGIGAGSQRIVNEAGDGDDSLASSLLQNSSGTAFIGLKLGGTRRIIILWSLPKCLRRNFEPVVMVNGRKREEKAKANRGGIPFVCLC